MEARRSDGAREKDLIFASAAGDRMIPEIRRGLDTVARELRHGGFSLVRQVYGHLGEIRHRSGEIEYRIEQQEGVIPAERLRFILRVI